MGTIRRLKLVIATLLLMDGINKTCCSQESESTSSATNTTFCIETAALNVHQCPTWFVPKNDYTTNVIHCACGPGDAYDIKCNNGTDQVELGVGRCMTFNSSTNMTYLGFCPYNTNVWDKIQISNLDYTTLPQNINDLNDFMCGGLNRTGLLCSQCQDGLGPAVLSYKLECLECLDSRYGWLLYISLTMLPTTLLCIVIIVFRFDATSASMNVLIIGCQLCIICENFYVSPSLHYNHTKLSGNTVLVLYVLMLTFYAFLNLDFFRYLVPPFCISNKMTTMQVIALDYTVALYPLILTAVVYYFIEFHDKGYRVFVWMWRPFRRFFIGFRRTWNLKGSVVNAFATFLVLSFSKFVTVSHGLLYGINPSNICGEKSQKSYLSFYDTSIEFFSSRHLIFAIPALLITVLFVIFPTFLLLFYQNKYFQKCLGCLRLRLTLLHELARIIQSCYKDGTAGTWDCRWFAGAYLLFRIFNFLIIGEKYFSFYMALGLLATSSAMTIFQPYKKELHNVINIMTTNIVVLAIIWVDYSRDTLYIPLWPINTLVVLPFVYFLCYILYNILIHTGTYRITERVYNRVVQAIKTVRRKRFEQAETDVLPYRLLHPAEYPPLLPKSN